MSIQVSPLNPVSTLAADRSAYFTHLLDLARSTSTETAWLQEVRDHAVLRVQAQTFPTTRNEEWRFTDLSDLLKLDLSVAVPAEAVISELPEAPHRLTFVNGFFAPALSSVNNLPEGLAIGNLSSLAASAQPYLGKQSGAEEVFTALNTTGFIDAAIVLVRKNAVIDTPIHLQFISSPDRPALIQPRLLVVAEVNSSVTLIEEHGAIGETAYFTNPVSEIWLAENAQVHHTRVQRDGQAAFHIGKTAVSQARTSRYTATTIDLGAKLSRHHLEIYQTGEQTETILNGLVIARDQQLSDTHSTIALTKPHGMTRQLHKCIIDDRAHAVFNGKVYVPKAAQLTDAGQLNRNLLLSPKARVDTKPQLEIVADNVKCTHGATVGQLETDEIFYLQSRGIDADSARKLLVNAFAYEVLIQVPIASLRQSLIDSVARS